jgi:hypothetical protein
MANVVTADQMLVMKSVINTIDPQFIFTWVWSEGKDNSIMTCSYEKQKIGLIFFNEDNSLVIKFGGNSDDERGIYSHTWNCELCNKNEFDPNVIAANVLRVLALEAMKDVDFSVPESSDWKSTLIKEFFRWATALVFFCGVAFVLWLIFGGKGVKTTENPGDTKGNVEVHP